MKVENSPNVTHIEYIHVNEHKGTDRLVHRFVQVYRM